MTILKMIRYLSVTPWKKSFGCGLAPYFYEAIKLRYPEYTQVKRMYEDGNKI
jgi:hypothetical protein